MKKILMLLVCLYASAAFGNDEYEENYYRKIAIHKDQNHHEYLLIQTNEHVVMYATQQIVLHGVVKYDAIILSKEDYKHLVHEFF